MPRPTIKVRSASKEAYEEFCKKYPKTELDFSTWRAVLYDFNDMFIKHILETGEEVKMPWGLGPLTICKKKQTTFYAKGDQTFPILPVDWVESKKLGYKVYILNAHTDGYRYKWYWYPHKCRFYHSQIWNFKPCRKISRLLAEYIKKPNTEYKHLYKTYIRKEK